jgi:MFS superfamily sulfate permease-like transporter
VTQNHESRKQKIQGSTWKTKSSFQVPTLLQAKMAQQCKQMRVGAWKGFAYHSVKVVILANSNRYDVDSNKFFLGGKAVYPFEVSPCPNPGLF